MSRQYNHDPRHFKFPRTMEQNGYAIEDCGGQSRVADKIVFICAMVGLIVLALV
jgi:hypothetical protein